MQMFSQSRFLLLQSIELSLCRRTFHPLGDSFINSAPMEPKARSTTACDEMFSCRNSIGRSSPLLTFIQAGIALATAVQYSTAMSTSSLRETSSLAFNGLSNSSFASYKAARLNSFGDHTDRDTVSFSTMPLKTETLSHISSVTVDSRSRLS